MNVSMNASAALAQSGNDAVGMTVLKKAINIEAQAAVELISAVPPSPQPAASNLPPHLGQNINTTA